jgi:N-acetylmuramoyl-L-alanine amidase
MKLAVLVAILLTASVSGALACSFDSQVHTLALNMYHEARGEGHDGMQMVGEVTLNRVNHPAYPDNVCDVVYQRRQFSWTHDVSNTAPKELAIWREAVDLSYALLLEDIDLFNNGATHFLNPNTVRSMPSWANSFRVVGKIGNHIFYAMES